MKFNNTFHKLISEYRTQNLSKIKDDLLGLKLIIKIYQKNDDEYYPVVYQNEPCKLLPYKNKTTLTDSFFADVLSISTAYEWEAIMRPTEQAVLNEVHRILDEELGLI